ncbi:3-mercaptopyruvate sulfurtransferase [Chelatococcus reniformis]|uniref:3-mercaptopyruvate sulfurtransferase n=1 Tax=Chelatococcus reniformis TaxID=1494448 RepID=A0A916XG89_9HYPH|nr:3-mercaptopyruvate sulfurtransferase [Chelatococcus reniformis]GGC71269.1 sulfurtransferase [Chelatococcus reniformis]
MPHSALVSTDWLSEHLAAPDLVVVDGSWYLPAQNRDPEAEYLAAHIPGAVRFDIERIKDPTSPLPHMMPRPEAFAAAVSQLGIGDGKRIVVYDGMGLFAAPRVWWMLRAMGAGDVAILDGGLPQWTAEGRPVEDGPVYRAPRTFTARFDHGAVAKMGDVRRALETGAVQVVDARAADRFAGAAPEPRTGLVSGHMPGALNVPSSTLIDNGRLRSREEIAAIFREAGVDLAGPILTTCGSGVSAAILTLGLHELGRQGLPLYDGSWTEWASTPDAPIATGPARPKG